MSPPDHTPIIYPWPHYWLLSADGPLAYVPIVLPCYMKTPYFDEVLKVESTISRRTERQEQGAGGPRDGQGDRKGQGRPQEKCDESSQEAETGSGGELVHKGHSTSAAGELRPPQRGGTI
eukprot:3250920-Pleurochrysis_carterae.AAC.1